MKTLRRLITILPLAFMLNCKLFSPPASTPIDQNTNHPPVANLSVNPESGYAPLTTNISLTGTDEDGNAITAYKVMIDLGDDGTMDETISQSTPINVSRIFSNVGDVRIYGQCTDSNGLNSDRKNIEAIVSKLNENKLPTANLSVNPTSGQYPLTTNISLTGTDSDGTVIGYKVEIDVGGDGKIEETINQSTPINVSRTFDDVENVTISGTITDNQGGETKKSVSVNALERNDLAGNISFANSYKVGDNFTFSGTVQNSTSGDIIIDNSNKDSLEYVLIKDGTTFLDKKFDQDARIALHNLGFIKLDYDENKIYLWNADMTSSIGDITWSDTWASLYPNGIPCTIPGVDFKLSKSGTYYLEAIVKYSMNGNNYHKKFISSSFSVGQ